jgi:hypothetical protein
LFYRLLRPKAVCRLRPKDTTFLLHSDYFFLFCQSKIRITPCLQSRSFAFSNDAGKAFDERLIFFILPNFQCYRKSQIF